MAMKLYCFGESGHAYRVALLLELSGVDWEPVYVDFFNGETRSPEFLALNDMGEVPVLVDGDEVLTQGALMQLYITEQTGKFGGTTPQEQRDIMRWLLFDTHKVSGQVGALRFQMNFLPEAKRNTDVINFMTGRSRSALKTLDRALAKRAQDNHAWIATTDGPSIADFALCGYLYYPEAFNFNRADYPAIDSWLARISALPGWKHPYDLMPGSPADRA